MVRRAAPPPPRLVEVTRRVTPSANERAWFELGVVAPGDVLKTAERLDTISGIPSDVRMDTAHQVAHEVAVVDVWCEVDVDQQWRAAFRLVPYAEQPVIAELRVFPRDDWQGRKPGEWRAEILGMRAPKVVGQRTRTSDTLGRRLPSAATHLHASFAPIRHGITAQLLRQIPVGAHLRSTRAFIQLMRKYWAESTHDPHDPIDRELFPQFTSVPSATPQRQGPNAWSDLRYAHIAAAYVARIQAGSRRALADIASASRGALSVAQVRDAVHAARRRGLLTATTTQGRPGGQLTRRAEAILRAEARRTSRRRARVTPRA